MQNIDGKSSILKTLESNRSSIETLLFSKQTFLRKIKIPEFFNLKKNR